VGHDDRQVGEVRCDVVEEHRVRVLQPHPAAAPHPRADAGLPGVEDGWDAGLLDGRVERVEAHVVRVERLRRGVELEPLDAVLPHQPADRPQGDLVAPRVDAAEGDEDVGVGGGELGDLFAGDRRAAGRALGVDGEDDAADVLLAVVGSHGVDRRLLRTAEQRRRRLLELPAGGVAAGVAAPLGDVHVHVDRAPREEPLGGSGRRVPGLRRLAHRRLLCSVCSLQQNAVLLSITCHAVRPTVKEGGAMTTTEAAQPAYPIESVGNALRLLLLLRERSQLRVSECAAELGVARSTAHRLMAMLEHYGFLRRDAARRTYRAGEVLLSLGLAAVSGLDIRARARPFMEALRDEVDETVVLVMQEGRNVRFVDAVETTKALRVGGRVGLTLPANSTSAGLAMLAAMSPEQVRELYPDATAPGRPDRRTPSPARLEKILAEVRETGYAVAYTDTDVEIGAVGVAIPDGVGAARAALAIAAPASRLTPELTEQLGRAALRTARLISMG
jgi:DNA-binding IclR family transcriptional regulator